MDFSFETGTGTGTGTRTRTRTRTRTINGTGNEIGTEPGIKICTDQKGFSSKTFFAGKIYLL